ncbi:hypothetical protein GCM10023069_03420 [Shinella granuli]
MDRFVEQNSEIHPQEHAAPSDSTAVSADVSATELSAGLPSPVAEANAGLPAHLRDLTDRARTYVEAASSANTRRAYASDWKHFAAWCRRQDLSPLPPDPQVVGLYITACASGTASGSALGSTVGTPTRGGKPNSVSTIERRLAAIGWNCSQRGMPLDRKDRAIATVMAGIRNKHAAAPPRQKEAILPEDLIAMLETLDRSALRGLRARAMLLIGFAGGLRRAEVTGLDLGRDQTDDSSGWIEILDKGLLLTLRGKTGWREVEIGRGSSDATCPSSPSKPGSSSPSSSKAPSSVALPARAKMSDRTGSTIRKSRAWSSAPRWPPARAAT